MEKFDLEDLQEESSLQPASDLIEDTVEDTVDDRPPQEIYAGEPARSEWKDTTFETKGGKKVVVRHDEWGSMWSVLFVPGGQLPPELSGKFTNELRAIQAVEQYLLKQD